MNQRFLNLTFTGGNDSWNVTAPGDSRECPPGHYLLFVINNVGTPSVGKIVQIRQPSSPEAPEVEMVSPANGGFVEPYSLSPPRIIKVSAWVRNPAQVARVEFYSSPPVEPPQWQWIGQVQTAQATDGHYGMTWNQSTPAQYFLKATAVKSVGNPVDSLKISVRVNVFPTVNPLSTTSPSPAAESGNLREYYFFPMPNLTVSVSGSDADGIALMELYHPASYLRLARQSGASINNYNWPGAVIGENTLTAIAQDAWGCETVSSFTLQIFPGALDKTFAPPVATPGANGPVYAVAVQADGKILIGGDFTTVNGVSRFSIARFHSDGSLDTGFQSGLAGAAGGPVNSIAVQSDKILLGGSFTMVNGTPRNRLARLNANDGSLDTSFNPNASGTVETIVIQSDGQILIGGSFVTVGGTGRNRIARLNSNGSLDNNFNPGAGADGTVNVVAVQYAGGILTGILIGGDFVTVGGFSRNRIARLNANGSLDSNFQNGLAGANATVRAIAVLSDGKMLMGGDFTQVDGVGRNRIARLNANGSLDTAFHENPPSNPNLFGAGGPVHSIVLQSDGMALIGGAFTAVNSARRDRIARLFSDGSLDGNFRSSPTSVDSGPNGSVHAIAIQADGRIMLGGEFTTYNVPGVTTDEARKWGIVRICGN